MRAERSPGHALTTFVSRLRRRAAVMRPKPAALAPALALAAVALAVWTQFQYSDGSAPGHMWYGFALAVALLAASFVLAARSGRASPTASREATISPRWELALALAVFALAAFFRFHRFLEFPPGIWYDEGVNATDAMHIIDVDHFTVWRDTNYGHATLYFYLLIASFKTFGYTTFALRVVPALAGLATVISFYFLARWLLGPIPALVATALLAAGRWAVTFSRVSWESSLMPLFEIWAIYFLVRALETRSRLYFVLAGASLAAGIYTYLPFRMVPVMAAFILGYAAITQWQLVRRNIPGLALYAASFLVVIFPLAQFALTHQDKFLERTRAVNVFEEVDQQGSYAPLRSNIEDSIKMMNVSGDENGRHNIPGAPMLDEVTGALFVLGFAVSLWSYRDWRRGALGVLYVLALVPGILTITQENPSAIRGVGAIPPIYLMAGLAVASVQHAFTRGRALRWGFVTLVVTLTSAGVAINYYDFFERQYNDQRVYDSFFPAFRKVGELIADEGADRKIFVSRDFAGEPSLPFLGRGKDYEAYTPATNVALPATGRPVVLVLDGRQYAVIPTLQRLYPHLSRTDVRDPYDRILYTRIDIPAEDIAASHELHMSIANSGDPVSAPANGRVDREWTAEDLKDGPIDVTWRGYLWASTFADPRSITVSGPGPVSLEIDGELLYGLPGSLNASRHLVPGEHRVTLRARIERPGKVEFALAPGEPGLARADLLYATSTGSHGFRVVYHDASGFGSEPLAVTQLPFAVPSDHYGAAQSIEYLGVFTAERSGTHGLALDAGVSAQLFVDGELVIDAGGGHAAVVFDGEANLSSGEHVVSIQYTLTDRPSWALYVRRPGAEWTLMDGHEFAVPSAAYRAPGLARLTPDPAWGGLDGRAFTDLGNARAVAVAADGTLLAASDGRLAFIAPDGTVERIVDAGSGDIVDVAVAPSGHIGVLDGRSRTLFILDAEGALERTLKDAFPSASGVGVFGDSFVVVSPSGGGLFAVTPGTGEVKLLGVSAPEVEGRAVQPSDAAQGPGGALYVNDFERKSIIVTLDGITIDDRFAGLTGGGIAVPRLSTWGPLLVATEPLAQRLVVYDGTGRQRGVFVFPGRPPADPLGVAIGGDGVLYVAGSGNGLIYRFIIEPPEDLLSSGE